MNDNVTQIIIHMPVEQKERLAKLCYYAQSEGIIPPDPNGNRPNYTAFTNQSWTMFEDYLTSAYRRKRGQD